MYDEVGGAPLGLLGRWLVVEARALHRTTPRGVTADQLAEAERGAWSMLAKKFSPTWIAKHVNDLVGQANLEYAEWLEDNPPADNPIGWLLNCVWWRALNRYESESRKPPTASLEVVVQLRDSSAPDPERELLDHDRQARLRAAISHLDEKEQKLLALVYFEDYSIREAGRRLGWGKSAVDRHHKAAMDKMRALVGDRSFLSPAFLGPATWIAVNGRARGDLPRSWDTALAPLPKAFALASDAIESGAHRLGEVARRLGPFADAGNAAATGGGGRVLGYCGAATAALVCGLAGAGVVGPGVGGLLHDPAKRHRAPVVTPKTTSTNSQAEVTAPVASPLPARSAEAEGQKANAAEGSEASTRRQRPPSRFRHPVATAKQSAHEFGDANVNTGSSGESAASSEASSTAPAEAAPAPESSGGTASGAQTASEFGD